MPQTGERRRRLRVVLDDLAVQGLGRLRVAALTQQPGGKQHGIEIFRIFRQGQANGGHGLIALSCGEVRPHLFKMFGGGHEQTGS
tara:strand:+ start:748 stop:1002 length:255 start_codon:yes stop_codon:yes gene_type:complete